MKNKTKILIAGKEKKSPNKPDRGGLWDTDGDSQTLTGGYTALTVGSPLGGICQSIFPQSTTHTVSVRQCVYSCE